jgi:hypothetical protein
MKNNLLYLFENEKKFPENVPKENGFYAIKFMLYGMYNVTDWCLAYWDNKHWDLPCGISATNCPDNIISGAYLKIPQEK